MARPRGGGCPHRLPAGHGPRGSQPEGTGYGNARSGTGGMPGFGGRIDELKVIGTVDRSRILTPEQIAAIVAYERSL